MLASSVRTGSQSADRARVQTGGSGVRVGMVTWDVRFAIGGVIALYVLVAFVAVAPVVARHRRRKRLRAGRRRPAVLRLGRLHADRGGHGGVHLQRDQRDPVRRRQVHLPDGLGGIPGYLRRRQPRRRSSSPFGGHIMIVRMCNERQLADGERPAYRRILHGRVKASGRSRWRLLVSLRP